MSAPTLAGSNVEMWNPTVASLENLDAPRFPLQEDDSQFQGALGSTSDSQECFSMSGPLTDGTVTDWPWHVFESNAFLLSEPLPSTGLEGDYVAIQRDQESGTAQMPSHDSASDLRGNASSDEEHESDLVQQVSTRFGALRISADGQLRYFGAATNYHLLEGSRHDEDVEFFTTKHEMLDRLEQAGLNQEVPSDLEEHLLQLYFLWHNSSHVTVDRGAFDAARTKQTSSITEAGYSSDFLVNAIYEAARGRDARTWLYGGMAMRLCFDLGLHIDCALYVKAEILTPAEARARQITFWSCVVLNHLSSFHFGRPFRVDSEEITVQPPYRPGDVPIRETEELETTRTASQATDTTVLREWVFLCETLVPLMRKL
ncbi:hypothetical protein LTR70_007530 [Exophiala xenobiotica]|uniref:Xylanolytic transcriptional activator regulatory domain-containing protein n=1 Tax=Lithohypha guttulata TaxID=1690604 RepID=A0ABR0K1L6_9EURO|nr:hypothetical protein LTR24_007869 [Lithohypha guttulata]KAK5313589.1 hypothetical protein LTR70_007530 [Exophiala xenobiotica]